MGKRADEILEGGLHRRETASRIEQKFSTTETPLAKKTRAARKNKLARKIQVEARPVQMKENALQQEELLEVWLRIVALTIQDGIASGALARDADGNLFCMSNDKPRA